MRRNPFILAALSVLLLLPADMLAAECGIDRDGTPMAAVPASVEIAFSPDRGATALIVKTIASAKSSVRVAAYSFTSKPIATALLAAQKRGVDVRVVLDQSNVTASHSEGGFLSEQGVPVRLDYQYAILHDKFIVVDGVTVETGSFNFSKQAERENAENVLVLHDPVVAQRYAQEWGRLWGESEEMKARY